MKKIYSIQNPLIKDFIKLQEKSKVRKKKQAFLVEGKRELLLAIAGGYQIKTILFVADNLSKEELQQFSNSHATCIEITIEIYQKLAYRTSTEGVIAMVTAKDLSLKNIKFKTKNPLIIITEAIEKPGNIGAILRTADAANVDAVFIANIKTDIYNPNSIRSSVGCLFTNQIAVGTSEEIIKYLQEKDINIYAATLQNANSYTKENYTKATAIVVGTEATGLTEIWRKAATKNIYIPMQGKIDSINVSVATAILIFEAKRQRNFL